MVFFRELVSIRKGVWAQHPFYALETSNFSSGHHELYHENCSSGSRYPMVVKKSLRFLGGADLINILALEQQCSSVPWATEHFQAELDNPVASILGCEFDGHLAGFICYWLIAGEMQILNVAVAADYRRRKIATVLLERAFLECRKLELDAAWLEVRVGNAAAIGLYRQFGFIVNGCRQHYYSDGEDALLMLRKF